MRESRSVRSELRPWRVLVAVCGLAVVILATRISHNRPAGTHHHVVARPVVLTPLGARHVPVAPGARAGSSSASARSRRSTQSRVIRQVASQDPQDRRGGRAARRAARALARHRALQHVPYNYRGATVNLTGASGDGKAVLTVTAPTLKDAKADYRRFLARYHDTGRAYQPHYVATRRP